MKRNTTAILFLVILLIILTFIVGVRYGGYIERINKVTAYLLSVTPAPSPTLVPAQTLTFTRFTNTTCGVSFLYPNTLDPRDLASTAAHLNDGEKTAISLTCGTTPLDIDTDTAASAEVKIGQTRIPAQIIDSKHGAQILFTATNPQNRRRVTFVVDQNLVPLIEGSLTFSR